MGTQPRQDLKTIVSELINRDDLRASERELYDFIVNTNGAMKMKHYDFLERNAGLTIDEVFVIESNKLEELETKRFVSKVEKLFTHYMEQKELQEEESSC